MTKIEHKDGANVKLGFTYALDDNGNITRTTENDGTYWDYEYDGRDRLTLAERNNSGATITASYAKRMPFDTLSEYRKTYLAARGEIAYAERMPLDTFAEYSKPRLAAHGETPSWRCADMPTKVEPFVDDHNDGNHTGWVVPNGSWLASSTALMGKEVFGVSLS